MICLHPSKSNPTSWRLQNKSLNVQEYFPFKKHGSKETALTMAKKRLAQLNKQLKAKKLRQELDFNSEGSPHLFTGTLPHLSL